MSAVRGLRTMRLAFGAGLAATLLVALTLFQSASGVVSTAGWAAHSHEVRAALNGLSAAVFGVESAIRGFLIEERTDLLPRAAQAEKDARAAAATLRSLLRGDAEQERRLAELDALLDAKMSFQNQIVATLRASGQSAARELFAGMRGVELSDQISALVDTMDRAEAAAAQARAVELAGMQRWMSVLGIALSGMACLLLCLVYLLARREIRHRDAAEEARRDAARQSALLRLILASMGEGVVVADRAGGFVHVNPAAERLLGRKLTDGAAAEWSTTYQIYLPDREAAFPPADLPLARAIEGEVTDDIDMDVKRPDTGERRRLQGSGRPLQTDAGERVGGVCVFRDVTEQRRAEADLRRYADELAAAYRELEGFSYSVSHDLRAPLRHMDGFLKLLASREQERLDATSARYLRIAAEASARMGRLIDDLLSFSRTARDELRPQDVALDDLVREVREELTDDGAPSVEWRIGPLPVVRGDPALLRHVWANLLGNALKYSRPVERPIIEVAEVPDPDADAAVVVVRDNGVGFDPKYSHKLFGVFQRLHSDEEFEGTGIGLAVVQRIVSRHGGQVRAEGAPGRGAAFYLTLPRAHVGRADEETAPAGAAA